MADYWKSQEKKHCDYCKCWITNNRASIDFHENGKRHKTNMAEKIKDIGRKSTLRRKEDKKMAKDMAKVEKAALEAYLKDSAENPDLTSKFLIEQKLKAAGINPKTHIFAAPEIKTEQCESERVEWREAKSDEGNSYYWNVETGETKWDVPEEGFLPLIEQIKNELKEEETDETPPILHCKMKKEDINVKIESGAVFPDKFPRKGGSNFTPKKTALMKVKEEKGTTTSKKKEKETKSNENAMESEASYDPWSQRPDGIGLWQPVQKYIPPQVDLQLPKTEYIPISIPVVEEEQFEFGEKTMVKEGGGRTRQTEDKIEFKKRKIFKGNVRNRGED